MSSLRTLALVLALAGVAIPNAAPAQGNPPPGTPPSGVRPEGPGQAQQASGTIRGVVVSATGQPIPTASVSIHTGADNQLVTGALSGADGSFRIEGVRPGRYTVRVSALGYATTTRTDVAVSPTVLAVELGRLSLAVSAIEIEGISVTSERRDVTLAPDRNTYRVSEMPAATGGTAVDVLRNVPAIEVDADNRVSLRGAENVVVQINGRPTPMRGDQLGNFLAQLPSDLVDRVEVVPNPSAKYDPEGMAGIVNIALKENTELGLSGGVSLGGGTTGQRNASGNLGYQVGALTLFGSYGFRQDNRESTGFNNRQYLFPSHITYLETDTRGEMRPLSHSFNGSAEYRLGRRDVLSSGLIVSSRGSERDNFNFYREMDAERGVLGLSERISEGMNDDLLVDYTLAYKHTVQPRLNEFSVEARFSRSVDDNQNLFTSQDRLPDGSPANNEPELERNRTDDLSRNWTLQADWTRAFGESTRLETGYKGTLRQLDSDFSVTEFSYSTDDFVPDLNRSNAFRYQEQVHAAYAVLSGNRGSFDWQAGLRAEQALTEFNLFTTEESFDNQYRSLFPSALLAYNLDDSRQLKASYSKRVSRPHTRQLNPFGQYEDPLNIFRGNPYLTPEYTHAFEAGYQQSFRQGTLQLTPFYRHTTDAIRFIRNVDDAGVSVTTFQNVAESDSYGADLNGSLRLGKLTGFGGFSAYRQVTDASNVESGLSTNALGWSARANATWRLTSSLDAQGFLMYRAPMRVEQGRMGARVMTSLALRQKLLGDKASLTLRVMDPFNQMGFSSILENERLYQETERRMGARGLSLTFSYNFGQQPRRREGPREEEQEPQMVPGLPGSE